MLKHIVLVQLLLLIILKYCVCTQKYFVAEKLVYELIHMTMKTKHMAIIVMFVHRGGNKNLVCQSPMHSKQRPMLKKNVA